MTRSLVASPAPSTTEHSSEFPPFADDVRESSPSGVPLSPRDALPTPAAREHAVRRVPTWWRDYSIAAGGAILLFVVVLWGLNGGVSALGASTAEMLTSSGRLTGLLASALLLIQVFLMARVPFIERAIGQDQLARTHKWVGIWSFLLMIAHIGLILLGYAAQFAASVWGTLVDFTLNYPGGLIAVAGTVLILLVVATSAKVARRKMRYESWHLIHLYAYFGVGLALPHQLWLGENLSSSTLATVFWWSLYIACAGSVIVFRVVLPIVKALRAGLRVTQVEQPQDRVVSVTVSGPGVRKLKASGGQFFYWRFLTPKGWSRANPFSLSAAPSDDSIRLTAAIVGDGTSRLTTLKPGTRVLVEGPYGTMHAGTRQRERVLLMGAGIGITPMRSLLESLPQRPGDVTIVNRADSADGLVLHDEITALAAARGARYETLAGQRNFDRDSWLPGHLGHISDAEALRRICPDIHLRDVFVCGAGPWMDAVEAAALEAGVPKSQLHVERFDL